MGDTNITNDEVKKRQATETSTGNRRQATEPSMGNRRQATEPSTGNRRQATEPSVGDRLDILQGIDTPENTYTKAWNEAGEGSFTELQQYLLQNISSARFDDIEEFKEAVKGITELSGLSGQKYEVLRVIDDQGGESVVLYCQDARGNKHAAKIYYDLERRQVTSRRDFHQVIKVRTKVIEFSKKKESASYVLPIEDIGMISLQKGRNNYFEIQPFCEEGDMSAIGAMTVEELLPVIEQMNEAIHYIHENGLLHMDIKPENLYRYNGRIVIGDFGIAHIMDNNVRKTEHAGGTDGYRAPETLFIPNANSVAFVLTGGVDYYSFGVTLATLFQGSFIFEGIEEEMANIMLNSYIPLPDKKDEKQEVFQNLVNGLCQYDSKVRFGYEDVKEWLVNPFHKISVEQEGWKKNYTFEGIVCKNELELFEAFSGSWEQAKKRLYRGLVKDFFADMNPDLANRAIEIVEVENPPTAFPGSDDVGLFKFLKFLYPMGQIMWRGHTFAGLAELGEKMRTSATPEGYGDMLKKRIVSMWLVGIQNDKNIVELVDEIETLADENPELACRWFGYAFAKNKEVEFLGTTITTAEEMAEDAVESAEAFYGEGQALAYITNLDINASLFGFLYSQGFRPILKKLFSSIHKMNEAAKAQAVLYLLEEIAVRKENEELTAKVRHFYKFFGPHGYIPYLQSLITSRIAYFTENAESQRLLDEIETTPIDENQSVVEMTQIMEQLVEKIMKMLGNMQNNPFLMEMGIMENKNIECRNLCGYFSHDFLGNLAPLGYESMLSGAIKEDEL